MMEIKQKERDYFFDNYKALLMVLVVIGHALTPLKGEVSAVSDIKYFIYTFHMPAFIFVSGYFCRKFNFEKICRSLLVPYVLMQIVMRIFSLYIWEKSYDKQFFSPAFSLWFLTALFFFRLLMPVVRKIPGIIFISFFIGIIMGYDKGFGEMLDLRRMVTFFPFFVLGNFFDEERFMELWKKKWVKVLSAILLVGIFFLVKGLSDRFPITLLEGDKGYHEMKKLPHEWAWLYRTAAYILGVICIYLIGTLIPKTRHFFSKIGQHTMAVYLSHGIVLRTIRYCTDWNRFFSTKEGFLILILGCILYCFVVTSDPVLRFFNFCGKYLMLLWEKVWGIYVWICEKWSKLLPKLCLKRNP